MDYKNYHRDKVYLENESLFKNIFTKRFELANKFIARPGKVLDVGASTGIMLDIFREHGWQTWGVESSVSAQSVKLKGHRVLNTFFEKATLPENYFDLVILNHTLEHMNDPAKVLEKARNVLKVGGVVYVDVPNAGGLGSIILRKKWPYLLPLEHKHQFTRQGLEKVFKQTGFKLIHFESRSGIFEYSNPILELWQSLTGLKKRFFTDLFSFPYALCATLLNMGDSMSLLGKKE